MRYYYFVKIEEIKIKIIAYRKNCHSLYKTQYQSLERDIRMQEILTFKNVVQFSILKN